MQTGNYDAINETYTRILVHYVLNYIFDAITLQEDTTTDNEVSPAGELAVRSLHLSHMKKKEKLVLQAEKNEQDVIILTHTIVHPCLDVSLINNFADIIRSICNNKNNIKLSSNKNIYH